MRHCDYNNPVTLTAEKAVQIGKTRPLNRDVFNMLEGMNEEFFSQYKDGYKKEPVYYSLILMFFVWNAGRIEGIRAERKRRKQAHT